MIYYEKPPLHEIYHHGILGMKWGVRNGPPYPIGASDHSKSEKKAGWRKSLSKGDGSKDSANEKRRLTDTQKRAIKIGAAAVVTGLVVYGAYKTGALNEIRDQGKNAAQKVLGNIGRKPIQTFGEVDPKTGFKLTKESVSESLKRANPLRGTAEGSNNCTYAAVAGHLRSAGLNVTAKSSGGKPQNLAGILEDCFEGVKVHEGSATRFAKSPEDAAAMLKKRFGDNASGAVGIQMKRSDGVGHTFSWIIKDGNVRFLDYQQGLGDDSVRKAYWKLIDPNGNLTFARLDGLNVKIDAVRKYIDTR